MSAAPAMPRGPSTTFSTAAVSITESRITSASPASAAASAAGSHAALRTRAGSISWPITRSAGAAQPLGNRVPHQSEADEANALMRHADSCPAAWNGRHGAFPAGGRQAALEFRQTLRTVMPKSHTSVIAGKACALISVWQNNQAEASRPQARAMTRLEANGRLNAFAPEACRRLLRPPEWSGLCRRLTPRTGPRAQSKSSFRIRRAVRPTWRRVSSGNCCKSSSASPS